MPAPTVRNVATGAFGTTGTITGGTPTHQTNDILIYIVASSADGSVSPTHSTPTDYTLIGSAVSSGTVRSRISVFWKRATSASETIPSCTVTPTGASAVHHFAGVISVQNCVNTVTPYENAQTNQANTTNALGLTRTISGSNRLSFLCTHHADNVATAVAEDRAEAYTAQYSTDNATGIDGFTYVGTYGPLGSTTDTATITYTSGGTSVDISGVAFALLGDSYGFTQTETVNLSDLNAVNVGAGSISVTEQETLLVSDQSQAKFGLFGETTETLVASDPNSAKYGVAYDETDTVLASDTYAVSVGGAATAPTIRSETSGSLGTGGTWTVTVPSIQDGDLVVVVGATQDTSHSGASSTNIASGSWTQRFNVANGSDGYVFCYTTVRSGTTLTDELVTVTGVSSGSIAAWVFTSGTYDTTLTNTFASAYTTSTSISITATLSLSAGKSYLLTVWKGNASGTATPSAGTTELMDVNDTVYVNYFYAARNTTAGSGSTTLTATSTANTGHWGYGIEIGGTTGGGEPTGSETDTVLVSDADARAYGITKDETEQLLLSDADKHNVQFTATDTETVLASDANAARYGLEFKGQIDAVLASDLDAARYGIQFSGNEQLLASDSDNGQKSGAEPTGASEEILLISDGDAGKYGIAKQESESLLTGDVEKHNVQFPAISTDAVIASDSGAALYRASGGQTDSAITADQCSALFSGVQPTGSETDSVLASDGWTFSVGVRASGTDSVVSSDAETGVVSRTGSEIEDLLVSDAAVALRTVGVSVAEACATIEAYAVGYGIAGGITFSQEEAAGFSDRASISVGTISETYDSDGSQDSDMEESASSPSVVASLANQRGSGDARSKAR